MSWYWLKLVLQMMPRDYQPVFGKLLSRIGCLNYGLRMGCHLKQILITLLFYDVVNCRQPRQFLLFFPNVWHIQPLFKIWFTRIQEIYSSTLSNNYAGVFMRKSMLKQLMIQYTLFSQLSLNVAKLFNEWKLKCCLSVVDCIQTWSYRGMLYFVYLRPCLCLGLLIIWSIFFITIFIFIASNHIISKKLPHLFIGTFLWNVQPQGVA